MPTEPQPLTPLNADQVDSLRAKFPEAPHDYVQFLASHGYGELPGGAMLYSGIVRPASIFGTRADRLRPGIVLFGDDLAGTSFGFDTSHGWAVIAIDSVDLRVYIEAATFAEFVKAQSTHDQ
jgi:hypothetical protein